jgi:hypothetical protein
MNYIEFWALKFDSFLRRTILNQSELTWKYTANEI